MAMAKKKKKRRSTDEGGHAAKSRVGERGGSGQRERTGVHIDNAWHKLLPFTLQPDPVVQMRGSESAVKRCEVSQNLLPSFNVNLKIFHQSDEPANPHSGLPIARLALP